ncbi:MAG TPA: glycoside hydrolase family 57 protein [Candidatus Saccharimonadales bacterium]|nr:glycoside hydrolase family 57 protein [Candidatus Saccharimonadales bacterium]
MAAVCFYFQVHQPRRIKKYNIFHIGSDHEYFNDASETNLNNKRILEKVSNKCYLPTNAVLYDLVKEFPEFKISFSFSGVFLEQLEEYAPKVLESFQKLVATGNVEILSETYYHSLSFLHSKKEFKEQVDLHTKKIKKLFGKTPQIFRNTELIYNNELAQEIEKMGYKGIITEGADHILEWRSPNFVYQPKGTSAMKLLLKNYKLSDDVAFRFSSKEWVEHPLTAPKYAQWVNAINGNGNILNLFMDYETFGEHQWEDTGIFDFLRALPKEILKHPDNSFVTPSEAIAAFPAMGEIDIPNYISWADVERDLSAWLSNDMQHDAMQKIYDLEDIIRKSGDQKLIDDWRYLQTSDHFYYMCTKWFNDGDVHKYFNPYESPYDAYISFMNVLSDITLRLGTKHAIANV